MIRYYLKQDAVLPNVETFRPLVASHRSHILANLDRLVVKTVNESGGYGMLIGPASTAEQRAEFADLVCARPRDFIAQPTIALSPRRRRRPRVRHEPLPRTGRARRAVARRVLPPRARSARRPGGAARAAMDQPGAHPSAADPRTRAVGGVTPGSDHAPAHLRP